MSNENLSQISESDVRESAERVAVYIDGFNLYVSMVNAGLRRSLWLDLASFANNLLRDHQSLSSVHYFTALVNRRRRRSRQEAFLAANAASSGVKIHIGKFDFHPIRCSLCGGKIGCVDCTVNVSRPVEKQSDVNLGTQLGLDAASDRFDTAIIVSSDSDFAGAVGIVKELFPLKKIVVYLPPGRHARGKELVEVSGNSMHVNSAHLRRAQLPQTIQISGGHVVRKPSEWM